MLTILFFSMSVIILTSIFLVYYIYQLVLVDASGRGIERPKFWASLAAVGQNISGLIFYLFKRRNSDDQLSVAEKKLLNNLKIKISCLMIVDLLMLITFVISMIYLH